MYFLKIFMSIGVYCSDCGEFIDGSDAEVGDVIECDNCGSELEIVSVNPFKASVITEEK